MADGMPDRPSKGAPPLLVVLSGPSGVGKDAAINQLRKLDRPWQFVVTATTRPKRSNEQDGIDYIFVKQDEFQEMLKRKELLEHAHVYGNWYGVPKLQVREAFARGFDTILKIDVQGAATIKGLAPEALFIFLAPPSMDELRQRLAARKTEAAVDLDRRSRIAWSEMEYLHAFDYKVVNHEGCLDEAVATIDSIITAEKCRIKPRHVKI